MPDLETRVAALESFERRFWERQNNERSRYAYEIYVKTRCDRLSRANKEAAELAGTSKAVGMWALATGFIALAVGSVGLIFGPLSSGFPRTPKSR